MTTTCALCDQPAAPGDPLHLCRSHGGLDGSWAWAHSVPVFEDAA